MIGFKTEEAGKVNLPQEYLQRIVDSIVLAVPETECIYWRYNNESYEE